MFTERILERGIGEIRVIYYLRSARPCPSVCLMPLDLQGQGMLKVCVPSALLPTWLSVRYVSRIFLNFHINATKR